MSDIHKRDYRRELVKKKSRRTQKHRASQRQLTAKFKKELAGKKRQEQTAESRAVEPDGDNGEQAHCQKAFDDIHPALLEISPAGGVFDAAFKGADHHADGEQRPRKAGEKENNGADPFQFKKFHAHIAHEGKEIAEKAYDLPVDPVHQLIQNCRGNKVPNKYLRSPPKMQKAAAQVGDGLAQSVSSCAA